MIRRLIILLLIVGCGDDGSDIQLETCQKIGYVFVDFVGMSGICSENILESDCAGNCSEESIANGECGDVFLWGVTETCKNMGYSIEFTKEDCEINFAGEDFSCESNWWYKP